MKRIMTYTAVVLATCAGLYILWQFRLILLLFILSLFVASTVRPLIEWLIARGVGRTAAQGLTYLLLAAGLILFIGFVGDPLMNELNHAANQSIIRYESLHRSWQEGTSWQQALAKNLPPPYSPTTANDTDLGDMLPAIMNVTTGIMGLVAGLLMLFALSIYWSVDQNRFERLWLSLLPVSKRHYARDVWREMEETAGSYLRSQTAQSILAALVLGIVSWMAGYPYPMLLAAAGALGSFVPIFGGLLAALIAFSLGGLESTFMAIAAGLFTLVVFAFLEFIIEPRLWPRERRSLFLTILVMVPLVDAFGIAGLILAPLLATVTETIIRQTFRRLIVRQEGGGDLDELRDRHHELEDQLEAMEEEDAFPELDNLSQRLAKLLNESQTATKKNKRAATPQKTFP
jgi:predicted PurR-regulated permease PerM